MKIQYCSDLHLEFEKNSLFLQTEKIKPCGEVLLLAGDITPLHPHHFTNPFFDYISANYEQVFWVPGNHEYYYTDLAQFNASFTIKIRENVNIVSNVNLLYKDVRFIFSTLWTKIAQGNVSTIEQNVADFSCILKNDRRLKAADYNILHQKSIQFIKKNLEINHRKTIVMTHHTPSRFCTSSQHQLSAINEAFCVDLTDYIRHCGASFWIYGHSHFNQKPLFVGNTILLTNQLGYLDNNEHLMFKKNAFFSI